MPFKYRAPDRRLEGAKPCGRKGWTDQDLSHMIPATALFKRACALLCPFAEQVKVVRRLMQGVLATA